MRMTILKYSKGMLNEKLLHYCEKGDLDMAVRTVHAGADLGTGDWLNDTPLHVAVTFGFVRSVSYSISASDILSP